MEKHYVSFYIAGSFFQERELKVIENRNINELRFPAYTFGFELFSKVKENGKTRTVNKEVYLIGKALTLQEVEMIYGKDSPAYRNVKRLLTKNSTAFYGIAGNLQVVSKKERILNPHTLPQFPSEVLRNFDKRLSVLNSQSQEL